MILEMSEEFVEWLNECPCEWYLIDNKKKGQARYEFVEELKEVK
jgi:hypothetical protein